MIVSMTTILITNAISLALAGGVASLWTVRTRRTLARRRALLQPIYLRSNQRLPQR
jgi:hypothetical protein